MLDLQDIKRLYFIGIGGIGMSAIARYFLQRGVEVHGYDRTSTELTRALEAEGMQVHYDEDVNKIPAGVDLVVYTPAVPTSHAEYQYFLTQGTPIKKRAEVLGIISRGMKTVAIAGTHGKTTTSSLTAHLLRSTGVDCTAFLGGIARNFESNYVLGSSEWVVVEADEFDRSFLHLHPDIASIMSMDADHLDIYGDAETLLNTGFKAFAKQIKPGGTLWLQHNLTTHFDATTAYRSFGVEGGDYQAHNIRVEKGYFVFDYLSPEREIKGLRMPLPGRHNIENATVAMSIALQLGASDEALRDGLEAFRGVKRRFEIIHRDEEVAFFDDYAHHPTELNAAIGAARELFPAARITGVFQPHLYSRTRDFAEGFAEALDGLDEIYLLDIYPARELPIPGVSSEMLVKLMRNPNVHLITKAELLPALQKNKPEVLLTLGAGDIDTLVEPIGNWLKSLKPEKV
ncbi:UDP-N-acetylmuramate--L-alanine ligase [Haliscomenobacter hydrossis]|uniref:UDP-N-acetylmuramate--L-alanine ligase n=1 Tax=Haliscomenobacter hydrossis (strain ATCC 27775 / DSM 1100 / LMG 10767 / O) TaxID=760192 RepID=F4KSU3_HALH1|nr:UDP-N-acetylmuramate--L-alanine ligase [Haliscomenobacter hydrossis]AEE49050.1 UDP-N-acetylmuramate--L-alanine ligase [Haliscomenobacter hydrossis DSM 1100]